MDTRSGLSYFIRFSALLEAMPDALVIVNEKGQIVLINRQTENLFGFQRGELLGENVENLMPERFRNKHPTYRNNYFANPRMRPMGSNLELFGLKRNGDEFPIEISLSPINTEDGQYALAAVRDISTRKKAEAKFKAILEATPDCLVIINSDGTIVLINATAEKLFGYTRDEIIGQKVEMLIPKRFSTIHLSHRSEYFKQPRIRPMGAGLALHGLHKDGHEFPVEISLSPLETEEGFWALAAVRDITDRKKIEEAKAMLSAIVQYSSDAIIGKDLAGKIFSWNEGAERLYGYTAKEAIGKPISFLFPPDKKNEFNNILKEIDRAGSLNINETYRIGKGGKPIPVSVTISPIKDLSGKLIGVSSVARDITDQIKLEEALRSKNVELENANLAKDRFLASMSHELRTPLNAIIGFTGTLLMKLQGPLNADQEKQLRTVQTSGKHLLSLINDILDLTKIESGKIEIHLETVDCNEIVNNVVGSLLPSAQSKNIELKSTIPATKTLIKSDIRTLTQILINLANNAIKYTDKGYVHIQLSVKKGKHIDTIVVDVIDTGIGIKKEDQAKLFKAFEQLNVKGKIYEGTGLGLHVSKKLAALINASIEIESEYGKGSKFSIVIPNLGG